jgi:hypothetical protein
MNYWEDTLLLLLKEVIKNNKDPQQPIYKEMKI